MNKNIIISILLLICSEFFCQDAFTKHICDPKIDSLKNERIYDFLDKYPNYKKGYAGLEKYLKPKIKYFCGINIKSCYSIPIDIAFIVDKNGKATKVCFCNRGRDYLGSSTETEITKAIESSPDWTSGEFNGQKANARIYLTIHLCLP